MRQAFTYPLTMISWGTWGTLQSWGTRKALRSHTQRHIHRAYYIPNCCEPAFPQQSVRVRYIYTPIHEQIHIYTVSPKSSFTGDQADALSIKTFFPSLAVLHLWKPDRSVGECDTHSLAWGSLGSFYKHPLKKEKVDTVALWGSV